MIGAKSAVPKREVVSEGIEKTREGARGDVYRGQGDEKEVGLLWVQSDKRAVEERRNEEGLGIRWGGENEGRGVSENFERLEHFLVIWEKRDR